MEKITTPQLIKIKILMNQQGLIEFSPELAKSFSDGRTTSVREMYGHEAWLLIKHLSDEGKEPTAKERMQRKILSMAHEQGWKLPGSKINMAKVNAWCMKYGAPVHKPFNDYNEIELPALVTQFEKMYAKHLSAI